MTLDELIAKFRRDADDRATPPLWCDLQVTDWLNEAETEAARRSRMLVDSTTSAVTRVAVTSGEALSALDPRVIFVRRVQLQNGSRPLTKMRRDEIENQKPDWETDTGDVLVYCTDSDTGFLRWVRIPDASTTANLTVIREPLVPMAKPTDTPEIAPRYHRSLVSWALFRAYSQPDTDTANMGLADRHLAIFEQEFGRKSTAVDEAWIDDRHGYDQDEGLF